MNTDEKTSMTKESHAEERPLVTFSILCYNQKDVVERALRSALAQDYGPLEILVSDDSSTDDTFRQVEALVEAYDGPHSVRLNRNDRNLGIAAHVDRVVSLARGEFIVVNAGDDASLPHRTRRMVDTWLASGRRAHCIHSDCFMVDPQGDVDRIAKPRAAMQRDPEPVEIARHYHSAIGATLGWSRDVFTRFGPLHGEALIEDHVIPFRAALLGEVAYIDEPLVQKYPGGVANLASAECARDRYFGMRIRELEWTCADYRQFAKDIERIEAPDRDAVRHAIGRFHEASALELRMARAGFLERTRLSARAARHYLRSRDGRYARSALGYGLAPLSLWAYDARAWWRRRAEQR